MSRHHEIADAIRAFIDSDDQTIRGGIDLIASEYVKACVEINARLSRCDRLLKKGLRSEAIQLADVEPNLLDSVIALDIPDRSPWDELARFYGWPIAPLINGQLAGALNSAYADQDPLRDLLRRHRRLVIERAPLVERIAVLRSLAKVDTQNPVWPEDIRIFERARLEQIRVESDAAAQNSNIPALTELVRELDATGWTVAPPKDLVATVKGHHSRWRVAQAKQKLEALGDDLNRAASAYDASETRRLRKQWQAIRREAQVPDGHRLLTLAAPALAWLDDLERRGSEDKAYELALQELEESLEGPVTSSELKRRAATLIDLKRGMPESIRGRFHERVIAIEAEDRRWRDTKRILYGIAAGVVLLVVALLVRDQLRSQATVQSLLALGKVLEEGDLETVAESLERLDAAGSGLSGQAALVEFRSGLESALRRDADRSVRLKTLLQVVETADVLDTSLPALDEARSIARTKRERGHLESLVRARSLAHRNEVARREASVGPRLESLTVKLAEIQDLLDAKRDLAVIEPVFLAARSDLSGMLAEVTPSSVVLTDASRKVRSRMDELERAVELLRAWSRTERGLTESVSKLLDSQVRDVGDYARELNAYAQRLSDTSRAADLRRAGLDAPIWQALLIVDRLRGDWAAKLALNDPKTARARASDLRVVRGAHGVLGSLNELASYERAAESAGRRDDEGAKGGLRAELRKLFSDVLIDKLWLITVTNSQGVVKRYYSRDPRAKGTKLLPRVLMGLTNQTRPIPIGDDPSVDTRAPQTLLAAAVLPVIEGDDFTSKWETKMLNIASLVQQQPNVDPLLRATLLNRVLKIAAEGSEPMRVALQGPMASVAKLARQAANVAWMDPDNTDANRIRPDIQAALAGFGDVSAHQARIEQLRAEIESNFARFPRPCGWVARGSSGWTCRGGTGHLIEGDALIPVKKADGTLVWKAVGTVAPSGVSFSGRESEALIEGRLLFVTPRAVKPQNH